MGGIVGIRRLDGGDVEPQLLRLSRKGQVRQWLERHRSGCVNEEMRISTLLWLDVCYHEFFRRGGAPSLARP